MALHVVYGALVTDHVRALGDKKLDCIARHNHYQGGGDKDNGGLFDAAWK